MTEINWNEYVFIDAETGGLDSRADPLLEVSYAVGLEQPVLLLPHIRETTLKYAHPRALQVNHFIDRYRAPEGTEGTEGTWVEVPEGFGDERNEVRLHAPASSPADWATFREVIKGKTWVGANPSFDVNFIQEYLYPELLEHHYHLFDIRLWWKGVNGSINMKSREDIASFEAIENAQYTADHTAVGDVLSMREAFITHVTEMGLG